MLFANWGAVARDAQIEGMLSSVKAGGLGRNRFVFLGRKTRIRLRICQLRGKNAYAFSPLISLCNRSRKRAACAPSICVW